jgi:hypothetical protein
VARRKVIDRNQPDLWRTIWQLDLFMLNRIEVIIEHGRDFFPDSSGSAILDAALKGLVDGKPSRSFGALDELNPNVRAAVEQLYRMRDAGQFGGRNGLGDHPAHRGEHPSGSVRWRTERSRGVEGESAAI